MSKEGKILHFPEKWIVRTPEQQAMHQQQQITDQQRLVEERLLNLVFTDKIVDRAIEAIELTKSTSDPESAEKMKNDFLERYRDNPSVIVQAVENLTSMDISATPDYARAVALAFQEILLARRKLIAKRDGITT